MKKFIKAWLSISQAIEARISRKLLNILSFIACLILGYSLALGRPAGIPQAMDATKIRHALIQQGDRIRVLSPIHQEELIRLTTALEKIKTKPGFGPLFPGKELAKVFILFKGENFENQYVITDRLIARSQGIRFPQQHRLIDAGKLLEVIDELLDAAPFAPQEELPESLSPLEPDLDLP